MSFLLGSCALAGTILLGRALLRTLRAPSRREASTAVRAGGDEKSGDSLAGFPCHLGDVLLASHGEEAWLAGALVFREPRPTAVLFIAPDAGGDRAVFARPKADASLLWLAPTILGEEEIGREPPSSLEIEELRFERTRRIPCRVERIGIGAPDLGEEVLLAEYLAATGDRLVVVVGAEGARAWRGRELEEGTYDRLPGTP